MLHQGPQRQFIKGQCRPDQINRIDKDNFEALVKEVLAPANVRKIKDTCASNQQEQEKEFFKRAVRETMKNALTRNIDPLEIHRVGIEINIEFETSS